MLSEIQVWTEKRRLRLFSRHQRETCWYTEASYKNISGKNKYLLILKRKEFEGK